MANRLSPPLRRHAASSAVPALVCIGLLVVAFAPPSHARESSEADQGPTLALSYNQEGFQPNPVSTFMYFVPLISRTPVVRETSAGNQQRIGFLSYDLKESGKVFTVSCDFKIEGKGSYLSTFVPEEMIASRRADLKPGDPLTNVLDYIRLEGEGLGRIVVKGTRDGDLRVVDEVSLEFSAKGAGSPVTIGLYDLKSREGEYRYQDRTAQKVARVSSLTFRRTQGAPPRLEVAVASIGKGTAPEGILADFIGAVSNLFIKPGRIQPLGNDTMLAFGEALLAQAPAFTFPKAANLREGHSRKASVDSRG